MDFRQFWQAYEDVVRRARRNELTMDDYAGTTISLTNPGGIGTVHSMPRLMTGPGRDHRRRRDGVPGAVRRACPTRQLAELAVSKIITLTSTYDHRIIQGAQSGEFLKVDARAAARRARLLRRDLHRRCASRTSRCAGCATSRAPPRARSTRPPG